MQKQSSSQTRKHIEKHKAILGQRRRELETRLQAIEHDFEEPRNPDDDDRATERNNDEVLEELGEAGQRSSSPCKRRWTGLKLELLALV